MNYSQEDTLSACLRHGSALNLANVVDSYGFPLNGAKLLYALAGQESSYGANCGPRFEPAYWDGSASRTQEQSELNAKYGRIAAMSYGPWQVMYANAANLGTPDAIDTDIDLAADAAVAFLNSYVIGHWKTRNLQEIARVYNSGNLTETMTMGVMRYIENVSRYYEAAPASLGEAI